MEQLEIEIKLRIPSHQDYLKLIDHLGSMDAEVDQLNVFFDSTDGQLARAGWALRVRLESKGGLVTLKGISQGTSIASTRREIEEEISHSQAAKIINMQTEIFSLTIEPLEFIRRMLPDIKLEKTVAFENNRRSKKCLLGDKNYTFEIDMTKFDGGSIDYELEVELGNSKEVESVEYHLRNLFAQIGIPFLEQPLSKFARALDKN